MTVLHLETLITLNYCSKVFTSVEFCFVVVCFLLQRLALLVVVRWCHISAKICVSAKVAFLKKKKKPSILIFRWKTLTYAALCLIPKEGMFNQPVGSISENCLKLYLCNFLNVFY